MNAWLANKQAIGFKAAGPQGVNRRLHGPVHAAFSDRRCEPEAKPNQADCLEIIQETPEALAGGSRLEGKNRHAA